MNPAHDVKLHPTFLPLMSPFGRSLVMQHTAIKVLVLGRNGDNSNEGGG